MHFHPLHCLKFGIFICNVLYFLERHVADHALENMDEYILGGMWEVAQVVINFSLE